VLCDVSWTPGFCVNEWILKVELNGEWEECKFPTQNEALSTFVALSEDYEKSLQRAILFAPGLNLTHFDGPKPWHSPPGRPN
jgi:hypothetical protein